MAITRRAFIGRIAGAVAVLAVAPYTAYKFWYGSPNDIVIAILRRRVGYLDNPPDAFARFAEEYVARKARHAASLAKLSVIAVPWTYFTLYRWLPMGTPLRRLEDNVVGTYLLSTDFFLHGGDDTRSIEYLSFYDPSLTPCRNPFAGLRARS